MSRRFSWLPFVSLEELVEIQEEAGTYWDRLDAYEEEGLEKLKKRTGKRRGKRTKQVKKDRQQTKGRTIVSPKKRRKVNMKKAEYPGNGGCPQRERLRPVRVSALMRLNRRVPNGTHVGVRGRGLLSPSYSFFAETPLCRIIFLASESDV